MNKVILYIATSLDGFIADSKGDVDWLPTPQSDNDLEVVGYNNLMRRIDTIVMGSSSYEQIINFGEWGWPSKQTYVFTGRSLTNEVPYIHFTKDSPKDFMQELKSDKDIWLLGGAKLAQSFAKEDLIDEVVVTIVPQTLGSGIPLGVSLENFSLVEEKSLIDGMIQKVYLRK